MIEHEIHQAATRAMMQWRCEDARDELLAEIKRLLNCGQSWEAIRLTIGVGLMEAQRQGVMDACRAFKGQLERG